MLMPSIRNDLFDDFFGPSFFSKSAESVMKTDIKETDGAYELTVDLPGFKKEDVKAQLNDGYLTISAEHSSEDGEKDKDGKYIRRERYSGSYSRSFYVGDGVTQEDIAAKFENGTLKLTVPKKDALPDKQTRYIAIE